ncbi:uncharacterized protein GGS22DRAFT_181427 [Annulohypoxylon maeteangense]|uniref:uncharacterized protein n=1 Tax=Annulohypoxylon maeteangense TaxID=1927788 RepID=UPI002007E541|nr:uncharacterized protein GGS22DRAFT_181427 [Annulohypoxylon maeteangense]KAI0882072.1 hypothetical protein GGS22DRAFT_181427 [Annulohypoxylon maeteangense]
MPNQESDILSGPSPISATARIINFNETDVDEYDGYFAMIIDNICTQDECANLLKLVSPADGAEWPPAAVTAYDGSQVVDTKSRFCGRIFYTSKVLADRLLERVLPFIPPEIVTLENAPDITGQFPIIRNESWRICRLNNKLRFLNFLTLHLYLNGGADDDNVVEGGATRFGVDFEDPQAGKLDIDPKGGSLVLFQQRDMYHEGATVMKGTKYTMRSDVMYEKI